MGILSGLGAVSSILGGGSKQNSTSNSTSSSSNQAYDYLKNAFGGMTGNAQHGTDAISAMLGLGGDTAGQNQAFDNFRNSTGYNFQMDQGSRAITGNAASRGLLNSGATLKALNGYGQGMAQQSYGSYMDRLMGLANTGFQAGNLISGAGNISNSTSTSKSNGSAQNQGMGGFLGSILSGIAGG